MAYTKINCLATGVHSKVFKAADPHGNLAAVKMTRISDRDTFQEMKAVSQTSNVNVVSVNVNVRRPSPFFPFPRPGNCYENQSEQCLCDVETDERVDGGTPPECHWLHPQADAR